MDEITGTVELKADTEPCINDGGKDRKWKTAIIGCGAAWVAATIFLGLAMLGVGETCTTAPVPQCVGGATAAAKSLGFTAVLWWDATRWLVGFAVVGYGSLNVAEKWVRTRNGKKPA